MLPSPHSSFAFPQPRRVRPDLELITNLHAKAVTTPNWMGPRTLTSQLLARLVESGSVVTWTEPCVG